MSPTRTRAPTFRSGERWRLLVDKYALFGYAPQGIGSWEAPQWMGGLAIAHFLTSHTLHLIHLHLISNAHSSTSVTTPNSQVVRRSAATTCPMSASTPCSTVVHHGLAAAHHGRPARAHLSIFGVPLRHGTILGHQRLDRPPGRFTEVRGLRRRTDAGPYRPVLTPSQASPGGVRTSVDRSVATGRIQPALRIHPIALGGENSSEHTSITDGHATASAPQTSLIAPFSAAASAGYRW